MAVPPPSDLDRADRLDGWKAIAAYLGRSVRTVQRWELTEGLPVHRHPHQRQASAWAYPGELEAWVARRSALPSGAINPQPPLDVAPLIPRQERSPSSSAPHHIPGRRARSVGLSVALAVSLLLSHHQGLRLPRAGGVWDGRDTRDPIAHEAFTTGRTAYIERRYGDALDAAQDAIARDASFASAWILLGKTYGRVASAGMAPVDAKEPATAAATRALELAPWSAEAHVAQALAARARRDATAWRSHARRAIEIDPQCAEAHAVLADSYSAQLGFACARDRNPELADAHYMAALQLDPQLYTARVNRAQNLGYLGRYEECAALLAPFTDASSGLSAVATRARCALMENDLDAAARDVQQLTAARNPPPGIMLLHRGWLRIERGDEDAGIRDLEAFADRHPSFQAELHVAQAYADVGEASRAADHLERAFSIDAACARTVAASPSFRVVRQAPEVTAALATYGVR